MGADDFITFAVLPAPSGRARQGGASPGCRIATARPVDQAAANRLSAASWAGVDQERHTCTWKGEPVTLTVTEFLILHSLAQRPGVVKSRDALMDAALVVYVDDRTIDSHIKRLRKKFKAVDDDFEMIETLYGVGYRFREFDRGITYRQSVRSGGSLMRADRATWSQKLGTTALSARNRICATVRSGGSARCSGVASLRLCVSGQYLFSKSDAPYPVSQSGGAGGSCFRHSLHESVPCRGAD